jgi:hypothetical protein
MIALRICSAANCVLSISVMGARMAPLSFAYRIEILTSDLQEIGCTAFGM